MLFSFSRQVALATYHAAVERWTNAKITLRNRGAPGERLHGGIARGPKSVRLIATIRKGKMDRPYPRRYGLGARQRRRTRAGRRWWERYDVLPSQQAGRDDRW